MRALACAALAVACFACRGPAVTAGFGAVSTPVLLGPVHRLGGSDGPTTKQSDFQVTAFHDVKDPANNIMTYSARWSTDARLPAALMTASRGFPDREVRLTAIRAKATGVWGNTATSVRLNGDLVSTSAAAKAATSTSTSAVEGARP